MSQQICHRGIVKSITDDVVTVSIATESSCGSCQAKTICGFTETSDKLIHAHKDDTVIVNVGDEVQVTMESSLGTKAVLLVYIAPLVILILSLLVCMQFTTELIAAGIAIGLMISHFLILHSKRHSIERVFLFSIKN